MKKKNRSIKIRKFSLAPNEIYKAPVLRSQDFGWWAGSESIEKTLPWTHVKKHVFPKSEMTAYVF
jgi:hypothetical protein